MTVIYVLTQPSSSSLSLSQEVDLDGNGTVDIGEFTHMICKQLDISHTCTCPTCNKAKQTEAAENAASQKKAQTDEFLLQQAEALKKIFFQRSAALGTLQPGPSQQPRLAKGSAAVVQPGLTQQPRLAKGSAAGVQPGLIQQPRLARSSAAAAGAQKPRLPRSSAVQTKWIESKLTIYFPTTNTYMNLCVYVCISVLWMLSQKTPKLAAHALPYTQIVGVTEQFQYLHSDVWHYSAKFEEAKRQIMA